MHWHRHVLPCLSYVSSRLRQERVAQRSFSTGTSFTFTGPSRFLLFFFIDPFSLWFLTSVFASGTWTASICWSRASSSSDSASSRSSTSYASPPPLLSDDISLTFRDDLLDGAAEERRYSFSSAFPAGFCEYLKVSSHKNQTTKNKCLKNESAENDVNNRKNVKKPCMILLKNKKNCLFWTFKVR